MAFPISRVTTKFILQMGTLLRMKEGASDHYGWTIAINQDYPSHMGTFRHPTLNA